MKKKHKGLPVFEIKDGEITKINLTKNPDCGVGFQKVECDTSGGIKSIYITQMPINLDRIDFMSELDNDDAKEVKERGGIDCVILSPEKYAFVKDLKSKIKEAENIAEECFQEIDDKEQGERYLGKAEAWKEIIKEITGNKPILNNEAP